jgi:hypothetical protein
MAISPFSVRPASPDGERGRARLALMIAAVGIVAIVAAYAISPGVRHAVSHAEHSVKHAVGHVFDPDHKRGRGHPKHGSPRHVRLVAPLHARGAHPRGAHTHFTP